MINLDEIEEEILTLEKRDTSYTTVERLAWLYIVRDHLSVATPASTEKLALTGTESDFLKAVEGAPMDQLFSILDEHMEAVRLIFPKEYKKLLDNIYAIKEQTG